MSEKADNRLKALRIRGKRLIVSGAALAVITQVGGTFLSMRSYSAGVITLTAGIVVAGWMLLLGVKYSFDGKPQEPGLCRETLAKYAIETDKPFISS